MKNRMHGPERFFHDWNQCISTYIIAALRSRMTERGQERCNSDSSGVSLSFTLVTSSYSEVTFHSLGTGRLKASVP